MKPQHSNVVTLRPIDRKPRTLQVGFDRADTLQIGPQPKLALHFKITEAGEDFGKEITAYYRLATRTKSVWSKRERRTKPDRKRLYAGAKSKVVRDLGQVLPDYTGEMPLPLARLQGQAMRVRTRWVTKDFEGEPLPEQQHYEIVDRILGP